MEGGATNGARKEYGLHPYALTAMDCILKLKSEDEEEPLNRLRCKLSNFKVQCLASREAIATVEAWRERKELPFLDFAGERTAGFSDKIEYPPRQSAFRKER